MADAKQLKILRRGIEAWNEWRDASHSVRQDLGNADLRQADLTLASLALANLTVANLCGAVLSGANLDGHLLSDAYRGPHSALLRRRLAADFTGWAQDNAKFEASFERAMLALQAEEVAP